MIRRSLHFLFVLAVAAAIAVAACEQQAVEKPVAAQDAPAAPVPDYTPDVAVSTPGNYLAAFHAFAERDSSAGLHYALAALQNDKANSTLLKRALMMDLIQPHPKHLKELATAILDIDATDYVARLVLMTEAVKVGNFPLASSYVAGDVPVMQFWIPILQAWLAAGDKDLPKATNLLESLEKIVRLQPLLMLHKALIADVLQQPSVAAIAFNKAKASSESLPLRMAVLYSIHLRDRGDQAAVDSVWKTYGDLAKDSRLASAIRDAVVNRQDQALGAVSTAKAGFAQALYDLATLLNQDQSRDAALIHLGLAAYLEPQSDFIRLLKARLLEQSGYTRDAIATYQTFKMPSVFFEMTHLRAAQLYVSDENNQAAMEILQTLLQRQPTADVYIELGDLQRIAEDCEPAIDNYSKALAMLGEPAEKLWPVFYARGICYERLKQWPKAEADLQKALELNPDEPQVLNYLGYSWVEQNMHLEQALDMLQKAVAAEPNDGYIIDSVGWAFFKLGKFQEAFPYLERAVAARPFDPLIIDHLGDVYWKLNRKNEAKFQWERALSFDPEPDDQQRIQKKLETGL